MLHTTGSSEPNRLVVKLLSAIGKIVSPKLREVILKRAPFLAIIFVYIVFGFKMSPSKDNFLIQYNGIKVVVPRNQWDTFDEIFKGEVYDQCLEIVRDDVVLDIGAHVGVFTVKAAQAVGEKGLVVAVEPGKDNLVYLRENLALNNFTNVKIVSKAASSRKGKAQLFLSPLSRLHSLSPSSPAEKSAEIEIDSVDNIVADLGLSSVNFIKIDVEGHELEVLRGAEKTLLCPGLKIAVAAYHDLPDGTPEFPLVITFLNSRDFSISTFGKTYIYATKLSS